MSALQVKSYVSWPWPRLLSSVICLLLPLLLLIQACDDPRSGPVGGLILVIQSFTAINDRDAQEISNIEITTQRIEVKHSSMVGGGADTLIADTHERKIIVENANLVTFLVGQYPLPAGYISQIRIFPKAVTVNLKNGMSIPLTVPSSDVPSWSESGWKINPIDGNPWPIQVDELTGVRALFSFDDRTLFNKANGYKIKPTVSAELFEVNPPTGRPGVFLDQLTVVFQENTTREQVNAINAQIGATVAIAPILIQAYRLKLPSSINAQDAFSYYRSRPEVVSVMPAVNFGSPRLLPQEGATDDQNYSKFPEAWETVANRTGAVGDWRVNVANIDTAIDVTRSDLIPNIFINQGEIPPAIRMRLQDVDNDGFITFYDLNHSKNFTAANFDILKDVNGNDCIDAVDLLDSNSPWMNKIDDDRDDLDATRTAIVGRQIVDDLIGYNFVSDSPRIYSHYFPAKKICSLHTEQGCKTDNDCPEPNKESCVTDETHGTSVSLALGASANKQTGSFATCPAYGDSKLGVPPVNFAGSIWNVSIAPLVVGSPIQDKVAPLVFIPDVAVMNALKYVEVKTMAHPVTKMRSPTFDIANVELWYQIIAETKKNQDTFCSWAGGPITEQVTTYHVPMDYFTTGVALQEQLFSRPPWYTRSGVNDSKVLYVWAAGNSSFKLSSPTVLNHISEPMRKVLIDNFLLIGYAESPTLSGPATNYGEGVVDLFAPANSTSLATPVVSGAAALIISQDACVRNPMQPCTIRHNPAEIKRRLVNRAPRSLTVHSTAPAFQNPPLCEQLEVNQPFLDANAAVQ